MARGIYKRGNIYWICFADQNGQTIRKSSGSKKFKDAQELLFKEKLSVTAIKEGKFTEKKAAADIDLQELVTKYKAWMTGRHKSFKSKEYRIDQIFTFFGNIPLNRFNSLIVERYQTELISLELKPASVNKNISILKSMIAKAAEWDMVGDEILKRVRKVKQLQENNRRLRYLSKEECWKLLEACTAHLKPIVVCALNTGMRKGEILSLKWDNVDLRHGFILLEITKNGDRREIPINGFLHDSLERLALNNIEGHKHVFHEKDGKALQGVRRSFKTACTTAGISNFHFHDLRHTFASQLVMAGVDLTTVKELLGHKSLTMTLRYAHLAPAHKAKAVDMMTGILTAPPESAQDGHDRQLPTAQLLHTETEKGPDHNGQALDFNGRRWGIRTLDPCRVKAVLSR
jgi:integrase